MACCCKVGLHAQNVNHLSIHWKLESWQVSHLRYCRSCCCVCLAAPTCGVHVALMLQLQNPRGDTHFCSTPSNSSLDATEAWYWSKAGARHSCSCTVSISRVPGDSRTRGWQQHERGSTQKEEHGQHAHRVNQLIRHSQCHGHLEPLVWCTCNRM